MAVTSPKVTVTAAAPVLLADNPVDRARQDDSGTAHLQAKNVTGTATVRLGGPGVTAASGWPWDVADGRLALSLEPGEELYGVLATGAPSQDVHVLKTGR